MRRSKKGRSGIPSGGGYRLPAGRSRLPVFELLELRALLSGNTYTPQASVADSSSSLSNNLRTAIAAANADTGTASDTILLGSGTYALLLGELEISNTAHSLIIEGQGSTGSGATIIDQLSLDRVFQVDPGVTVTFEDLEITGGTAQTSTVTNSAQGGGILSSGNVTLTDAAVVGNKATANNGAPAYGGGIYSSAGTLTIQALTLGDSLIEDNSAIGGAAPAISNAAGGAGYGGGIYASTSGQVTVSGTTISDNAALGSAGPSESFEPGGAGFGGGVYIASGGSSASKFTNDNITGNQAVGGVGGDGGNASGGAATGGGMDVGAGAPAEITDSTIAYNTAQGGVSGNQTGGNATGGGIEVIAGRSYLYNTTVYGNAATGGSGLDAGSALGGGVDDGTGVNQPTAGLSLVCDTIAYNSAQAGSGLGGTGLGGGISNTTINQDLNLSVANTIIAKNAAGFAPDAYGAISAQEGANLVGDPTGSIGFTQNDGDQLGYPAVPLDPLLGPLQNNGGPAPTAALMPGSPAIMKGEPAGAAEADLTTDERGLPRVLNNDVDIGAYETQNTLASTTVLGTTSNAINVGDSVTFTATVSATGGNPTIPTGTVTFDETLNGSPITIGSAPLVSGVATFQSSSLPLGTGTVVAVYSGDSSYLGSTSSSQSEAVTETSTETALIPSSTVDDSNSLGDNNLRSAVTTANADPGIFGDTIFLQAGTYALTQGAIDVTNTSHTLTIIGNGSSGPNATIITQLALDHVFQIAAGATLVLENVEITGGLSETDSSGGTTEADGGGIVDLGSLTLTNVAVVGNKAVSPVAGDAANGGGIYVNGLPLQGLTANGTNLIAYNSVITAAGTRGGASGPASGGGVYSTGGGTIDIEGTSLSDNFAEAGTGGSGNGQNGGAGGTATGGGASFSYTGVWITLNDDTIAGNTVWGGNGGSATGNLVGGAGGTAQGGGFADVLGMVNTTASTISGNTALGGIGGIGPLGHGAGGNALGGGIFMGNAASGIDDVYDDTIYKNMALGGAGENAGSGYGGGVEDSMTSSSIWFTNSTIASNTAAASSSNFGGTAGQSSGGGIDHNLVTTGSIKVTNTIIDNDMAATGPDFSGATTSSEYSLLGNAAAATGFNTGFDDNLLNENPDLGPLQNNGGPTYTMALLAGSPAIGAGNVIDAGAAGLMTDQRGLPRVVENTVDIGAYQTQTIAAPSITVASTTENVQTTSGLVINSSSGATTSYQITDITGGTLFLADGKTPVTDGSFITLAQGKAGLTFTPAANSLATGSFVIQQSSSGDATGLIGSTKVGTISVTLAGPSVTNATTAINTQTTSGLVITPGANDTSAAYFRISNIVGGTLYQHDGTTPIASGAFITLAQGEAGLKFTPTPNSTPNGSFAIQESTTNGVGGLSGQTATASIGLLIIGPSISTAFAFENTQTSFGLVVMPGVNAGSTAYFQITGITGGTLYQNDGVTPIANNSFITLAQGEAGLTFTPAANSLASGGFSAQQSTTSLVSGLTGPAVATTINVMLSGPLVTNSTTTEGTQTTSGLLFQPGLRDTSALYFYISVITGGTLYQNDGVTPISSGSFITLAQGEAGLKFTPTPGSLATGSFAVQESTSTSVSGLSGKTFTPSISVSLAGPSATGATTTENTQTTSGLVITPGVGDSSAAYFQITNVIGGTLYQNDGVTPITSGSFITLSQGEAGLKFTPTAGSLAGGSFIVQESTTNTVAGLSGATARAGINVNLIGPSVTGATTTENTQSTTGLVVSRGAGDLSTAYFQITGITGGALYQHDGITPITSGSFITLAQGGAGLKFTPTFGSLAGGGFTVQESSSNSVSGLSGATASATVTVTLAGPKVSKAATTENVQTSAGLVITPGTYDSSAASFQITAINGGTLYQHDGVTPITSGSFITLAQGAAGLKFTPTTGSLALGSFSVQESTTSDVTGLSGPTATATINVTLAMPFVTDATTTEGAQTTSGLAITPTSGATTYFQITGITGGSLYQNDGVTPIANNSFITVAQGEAGLKFTPTTGSLAPDSFNVQESTTNSVGGLTGATAPATITVTLAGPSATAAAATEGTQSTSGLVITPGAGDSSAAYFQITAITGGALYLNDGVTPITSGGFITVAQGEAGLKFTPIAGSLAGGGFNVRESTTATVGGLSGATAAATITVTLAGPSVTPASTTENIQSTSGLVITPGAGDSSAAYFQITNITGGTLYQNDGLTPITSGSFISLSQGAAGLKFTPTTGSLIAGSFSVQESTTNGAGGLGGQTATATITVSLAGPSVTSATTTENTQTSSGLVITPSALATTYFQITGITGGTLFQNDGVTPITSGSFITVAQGEAGLKFTPTANSLASGSFTVEESTSNSVGGLSGQTTTASITVTLPIPTVTAASTTEGRQTTSGLVVSPSSAGTTYFQIAAISGGTLYQNDGTTPITSGSFISLAQGAAGLKFTPTAGSLATGSFTAQESTTNSAGGLIGTAATATISVTLAGPNVTGASTTENTQTTTGLVITPGSGDSSAAYFQITGITGGTLFQNDGTTLITSGTFISAAQGEAGLKFTPTTGSLSSGSFTVQESTTNSVGGLSGATATATISVVLAQPSITSAQTSENTQSTSGLVITPISGTTVFFQITAITGGTLYQNDGVTPITDGSFITVAQGAAGLKFTPTTGSLAAGSFVVQESTTNAVVGLTGTTATATISVALAGPTVTSATTTEDTQTTSGLVIAPGAGDSSAVAFQITGITGGTLYQNNGTTPIANGALISLAQGEAGLKFTPTNGSLTAGSFFVRESTSTSISGLNGPTVKATIGVVLTGPLVSGASTSENTQTTSGLLVTPSSTSTTYFEIAGITGGTLYQNDGVTPITSGSFITLAQGEAGLKFTPTTGSLAAGSFTVQESTTNAAGGLTGTVTTATVQVALAGPTVTNAATTENLRTISGLAITPGPNDNTAAYFQITYVTGGTLYQNDGVTPIANGAFITLAQGEAGLKFTPNPGSLAAGGFTVRESTTNTVGGLSGPTARAAIAVTLIGPNVTVAATTENRQTASGLVITRAASDSTAAYFQITGISGGTLYQHNGTTPIAAGSFITVAQGAAGLKFTPTAGSLAAGSFTVQESATNAVGGLSGAKSTATINVTLAVPMVTNATTTENTQTTSGLVIRPTTSDSSAAYFQITFITGGTLYQSNGTTPIANGSFITLTQGAAGLKFTPNPGSLVPGGFTVRESTTASVGGLSGATARAAITVTLAGPKVTGVTTTENTQSTSGLVIMPAAGDTTATYFQITAITGGTLYLNNGTTPIANGSFITVAQGEAGLEFTPNTGSLVAGGFTVQESTAAVVGGLNGVTVRAAIAVTLSQPNVTPATTTENTQSTAGLVITSGPGDTSAAYFQITYVTGGALYLNDGVTQIVNGDFVALSDGAAGLKFTPNPGSLTPGGFTIRQSTTADTSGLSGPTTRAAINVTLAGPSATPATTTENRQSTTGLVIRPSTTDSSTAYFQIAGITGGTLYQNNGTTPIASGSFITVAQGAAGLKFTPSPSSLAAGGFTVRESTSATVAGLSGVTAHATVNVTLAGPVVTNTTTGENGQSISGLVIRPTTSDTSATYFQITSITGGTLYQNDGVTPIAGGSFITLAQGAAGLKFTPNAGSLVSGGFTVRESTTADATGLSGVTARAAVAVMLAEPSITIATTTENLQTASGLVITPASGDSSDFPAAYFQIAGITGGTLYQNNGTTPIANGSFITVAQGAAGLKFTPSPGSLAVGGFTVEESTSAAVAGLSGVTAHATVNVMLAGPVVTNATTAENTQSTSGLVIRPTTSDTSAAYFQITSINGGTLYQNDGVTPIANGSFITLAQGAAGLKFTPIAGSLVPGGFTVQESTTADVTGLSGVTVRAAIAVTLAGPSVTGATTPENLQTTSGLVIMPASGDSSAAYFQITSINGGKLYQNDGTTQIANGGFITVAQGAAGLKFTPNPGSLFAGGFTVRESTTADVTGLAGATARAAIAVTFQLDQAVNLSKFYNLTGITNAGATFSGGLDGSGHALPEAVVGTTQTLNNVNFSIAPAGASNVIQSAGQVITLPKGSFVGFEVLATSVNGNQLNQAFKVTYTDGSSTTFTQNMSDWNTPQDYDGENIVVSSSYRNTASGGQGFGGPFDVYGYAFSLDNTKVVQSITLPVNTNVNVLAISMVGAVAPPTNLNVSLNSSDQIYLTWTGSAGTITGYNIYRGTTSGGELTTPINSTPLSPTATSFTDTTFTDTTALPSTTYFYVVLAVDGSRVSQPSNEAELTLSAIAMPLSINLTAK
ncbi:MAG TPA: choice-of-anchor Q domain-containing protein [Pirellulales bacterium]|jgi:hypothetical protein|nr:choice-of-anchor Q domain-containing protein [Pirellulales bacterium]